MQATEHAAMNPSPQTPSKFSSTYLGNWESDIENHAATVIQRVRPPKLGDAEVLGLKRIEESLNSVSRPMSPESPPACGFIQGRGSYIREYFQLVILPAVERAQAAFRAPLRFAARTAADATYIVERVRLARAPHNLLDVHKELYEALASDAESFDVYLDFVVVSGRTFYDIAPEFFHNLLVAYQFPFGVVLMLKCTFPNVLLILSYSLSRGMGLLRSVGAGDPFHAVERPSSRRRPLGGEDEGRGESDEETSSLTSWYSKPWVHPARSKHRMRAS